MIPALRPLVDHPAFQRLTIVVIILNAISLGLETWPEAMATAGSTLKLVDLLCLVYFVIELVLKLLAHGRQFFRDGWNWFDLVVVGIALVPQQGALGVLRALRVLRVLRLISVVPQLRRVIQALFHALPGMGSIIAILLLLFYVAAVVATKLFGQEMPVFFGHLGASFYTLFQIMTLEGWAEIALEAQGHYPLAWLFFVPFILIITFAVLNLFIAVIVDSMQKMHAIEAAAEEGQALALQDEIRFLRQEIGALRARLEQDR